MIDILIIKPGAQKRLYGSLSKSLTGLEPPLWAVLLAGFVRSSRYEVRMVDAEIDPEGLIPAVKRFRPRLAAIVVAGTNTSASTMNMVGARTILEEIKKTGLNIPTILIGVHPSVLPERTLKEEEADMVCQGEGFYTLLDILSDNLRSNVRGLWYREGGTIKRSRREARLVDLNTLPMPAWDLLPMEKYRAHNWHCFGHVKERSPYAVIYTSMGCPYSCTFCCINALFSKRRIRYRDPRKVIEEIDLLVKKYNVKNLKIFDEMFALKEDHVINICDLIIERGYALNIWAYARVDTLNKTMLNKMKKAGINWLAIGFESSNKAVRTAVKKGAFDNEKIRETVTLIKKTGISLVGNFMFGLPDDNLETMQETLDMAKELNCEYTNFYTTMAYPGSSLYIEALKNKTELPSTWLGYAQFSEETYPLSTKYISNKDVLRFRDNAFEEYYSNPHYLKMIEEKFGRDTVAHIKDMLGYKVHRRLLDV